MLGEQKRKARDVREFMALFMELLVHVFVIINAIVYYPYRWTITRTYYCNLCCTKSICGYCSKSYPILTFPHLPTLRPESPMEERKSPSSDCLTPSCWWPSFEDFSSHHLGCPSQDLELSERLSSCGWLHETHLPLMESALADAKHWRRDVRILWLD